MRPLKTDRPEYGAVATAGVLVGQDCPIETVAAAHSTATPMAD